jgi:hypothetical protein
MYVILLGYVRFPDQSSKLMYMTYFPNQLVVEVEVWPDGALLPLPGYEQVKQHAQCLLGTVI